MIWRRILVSSDSTIEDLHYTVQLAMGWSDIHLYHFIVYGKQYGITQPGGTLFSDRASKNSGHFQVIAGKSIKPNNTSKCNRYHNGERISSAFVESTVNLFHPI